MEVEILHELTTLVEKMKENKPGDRSEQDRHWAIAITEAQKLVAWWGMQVVPAEELVAALAEVGVTDGTPR